jgi:hypothetical protein
VFTNQIREGDLGREISPGGKGLPFYASLRIRIGPTFQKSKIKRSVSVELDSSRKYEAEKVIGINSLCEIRKSSIDDPFREAPISIIFNYGIDSVRTDLQYVKDITKNTKYDAITKEFKAMENAIHHIEENNLELQLKNKVIDLWEKIEESFELNRKKKER